MGTKYSSVTVSGYNSSPPTDDGSQTSANQLTWAKHKTKLGDPIKTALESINTALVTAFDYSSRSVTSNDSIAAGDNGKSVVVASTVTSTLTLTLPDATTVAAGWFVTIINESAVSQTIGRATASNTISSTTSDYTLPALASITFIVSPGLGGYSVRHGFNAGTIALPTVNIDGGTIDGTTQATGTINGSLSVGGTWSAAATWTLPAFTLGGTVTSNGQSFSGTIANLGTVTTADINGGTLDGVTIGGASAAAITGTTITANTRFVGAIDGTVGATTPAAGAFTTLSATGLITSTVTGAVLADTSGGTNSLYIQFGNTGGNSFFGVDNSTGASLGSGTAYAFAIYTPTEIAGVIAGTKVTATTATGLAVTGTLSVAAGNNTFALFDNSATTGYKYIQLQNTSGSSYFGTEGSAPALITGASAWDAVLRGQSGIAFSADGGTSMQMRLSSTGLAVTGTITADGSITIGDNANPFLLLSPSSGATKTFAITQSADIVYMQDAGVANRWQMDLATGNVTNTGTLTVSGATITTGSTTALSLATSGGTQVKVMEVASAVDYIQLFGSTTVSKVPVLAVDGSDTNIDFIIRSKGTGGIYLGTSGDGSYETGNTQVQVSHTASANRYITLTGSNGGNPTIGASAGRLNLNAGVINVTGIPTSSAGLSAGDVYSNGGVLTVV